MTHLVGSLFSLLNSGGRPFLGHFFADRFSGLLGLIGSTELVLASSVSSDFLLELACLDSWKGTKNRDIDKIFTFEMIYRNLKRLLD